VQVPEFDQCRDVVLIRRRQTEPTRPERQGNSLEEWRYRHRGHGRGGKAWGGLSWGGEMRALVMVDYRGRGRGHRNGEEARDLPLPRELGGRRGWKAGWKSEGVAMKGNHRVARSDGKGTTSGTHERHRQRRGGSSEGGRKSRRNKEGGVALGG
jgi:hypothetical protein